MTGRSRKQTQKRIPMGQIFDQLKEMIAGLSLFRKISMVLVLVLAIGSIIYINRVTGEAGMEPLFTNLNSDDMGTILTQLDKQNIKYEVKQDQRTVLVPADAVLDVRMKLAAEGLPRFGGIGFELFDKGSFGLSDFEQQVNYQRALEGELSRTIGGIKEIESARVHLVLPEKSLFNESEQAATASVILKMGNGQSLDSGKVNAITHLVASAVNGLSSEEVTIVDTNGKLLTTGGGDANVMAGGQVFDQKMQIERSYEKRIVELLSPVVGLGKVIARVTAQIDFTRTESTDEIIDPTATAVMSESHTTSKKTESAGGSGGVAGAGANVPGGGSSASGGGSSGNADEASDQFTYEVSKTIRKQVSPVGAVKAMSVAILVDGTYTTNDKGEKTYAVRPPAELAKIEDLVKKAIGYNTERGDQIKVENMAFQTPEQMVTGADEWYKQKNTYGFIITMAGNGIVVVAVLLIFFLVIRPMVKSWTAAKVGPLGPDGLPLLEGQVTPNLAQLVRNDPMAAANAIRQWLQ